MWHSNAPWHASGYGVQTGLHVPRLQALGHDVAVSCNWGIENGVMSYPGPRGPIACYPKGNGDSQDILPYHAEHFQADAVVTLYDAWTIEARIHKPWVPYFPVDMEPVSAKVLERIRFAAVRVAMSRFGQDEVERAGFDCEYVPHCYDPRAYYPDDPTSAIEDYFDDAKDKFIVGVVAANKGIAGAPHRKNLQQIIQGFARFHKRRPDSMLYLHCDPRTHMGGLDLNGLCAYFGLGNGSVQIADWYELHLGMPAEKMRQLYSAMDVLCSPSMGEGFGVPIVEAQACGTPVITGDWTAMSEVTRTGLALPKEDAYPYYWPGYEWQFIVDPLAVEAALDEAYDWRHDRFVVAEAIGEYSADHVCPEYWPPVVERIGERLEDTPRVVADRLEATPAPNRAQRRASARAR